MFIDLLTFDRCNLCYTKVKSFSLLVICWALFNFKFPKLVIGLWQDPAPRANHEVRECVIEHSPTNGSLRDSSSLL